MILNQLDSIKLIISLFEKFGSILWFVKFCNVYEIVANLRVKPKGSYRWETNA